MPVDAGVGPVPFADEAVAGVVLCWITNGCDLEPRPHAIALEHEVLPDGLPGRVGRELEHARGRHDGDAFDGLRPGRRRDPGQVGASAAGGDPAAVDQHVHVAARDPQRRHDLVADAPAVHLVVEKDAERSA